MCTESIPFELFPVRTINNTNHLIQIIADSIRMDISGNIWKCLGFRNRIETERTDYS